MSAGASGGRGGGPGPAGPHDPDPAPSEWRLTSFDQLNDFTWSFEDDTFTLAVTPEVVEPPRRTERIEREVTETRTLGLRTWSVTHTVTIYRTVRP